MIFAAGVAMAAAASAETPQLVTFSVGMDSFVNGMSHNGRWATWERQAGEEATTFDVKFIDMTTGETLSYTPRKLLLYNGRTGKLNSDSSSKPTGVSDDGKTVYGSIDGYPAYFTVDDLTWHSLSMGSAQDNRNLQGAVYGWSGDGRVLAGWFTGTDMTVLRSALWVDGEIRELSGLPTYQEMFDLDIIDAYDFATQKDMTPNYTFRSISEDGKILLLGIDHNRPQWGCSYGIYNLETDKFQFILAPYAEYGKSFTDSAVLSQNGEWATGNMYFIGFDETGNDDSDGVYRYHIPTGKLEVFNDLQSRDLLATAIDNEGTIFAATPASQPIRNLVVRCDGLWVDLGKILQQKYGIDYYATSGFDSSGYAVGVSSDGKTILSQAEFRGSAFALTLPEVFGEAAKGTSLLTEYVFSPSNGERFSKLSSVAIRFTYGCVPSGNAEVTVKDADGNIVGSSTSFQSFSSQNILYTILFDDIALEEDKEYTVIIPANTFVVEGTTMGNPHIEFKYVGRPDRPVESTMVNPEENTYINLFSYNSPVVISYDATVAVNTALQPKLYEVGHDMPICNLSVSSAGSNILVYPASERRLSKDREYYIEIPAGLVTDLSGSGPSEAMKLNYYGAYVPTPSEDDARPFFEDFNSPNEAMYNFLLFDGDQNQPTEDMQTLGFDRYNTPWNFSIRDEGGYDYCVASHSCYIPDGRSDDWMIIPQLKLNDGDNFLTFKAQSYDWSREDILKIVVWEYDDVVGSIDEELFKKIKEEAKTLAEFQVPASQTTGTLEGSWNEYEFSLADYSGKNVYIGFVNQNMGESIIFIDDLAVEYRGAYTLSVASEKNLLKAETTDITAYVNINAEGPFKALEASIYVPSTEYSNTISLDNLALKAGDRQAIEFKDVILTEGEVNKFIVTANLSGVEQTYTGSIVNHAFEIPRRVMIEEGTGMWCGNCPLGEVAIEHLEETLPDNVAIISVHNGDAIVMTDYDELLALGGYPAGRVNRLDKVYQPLYADDSTGNKEYISPNGNVTFKDVVLSEISNGTEGEIKIGDATYYSADGIISLPIDVRFSVSRDNALYNIYTCVVEDGLSGRQTNYFKGDSSPIMDWWSAQPGKVDYVYKNVARAMIGGFYGYSGKIPSNVKAEKVYNTEIRFELPATVANPDNMHFVVALLDATTGCVINSDVCRKFTINPIDGAGIDEIASGAGQQIVLTTENGTLYVNGDDNVEVYSTSGVRMRNGSLEKGAYIVRKTMEDGSIFSKLVMVK